MEKIFWTVWNPQGRNPTYRHESYESAKAEAERLTKLHGGSFYVLEAKAVCRKPDVQWSHLHGPGMAAAEAAKELDRRANTVVEQAPRTSVYAPLRQALESGSLDPFDAKSFFDNLFTSDEVRKMAEQELERYRRQHSPTLQDHVGEIDDSDPFADR